MIELPFNDLWTIPGEEHLLEDFRNGDRAVFGGIDATERYHCLQDREFLQAVQAQRDPPVDGTEGRKVVAIIAAIYESGRTGKPVRLM